MTRLAGVLLLLLISQMALAALSPGLTHTAVKHLADVAPLVALLSGPALVGLFFARSFTFRTAPAGCFWLMIGVGFAMRLIWFGAPAPLENDFHRYLWDGAVVAAGVDPYAFAPEQIADGASIPPALMQLAAAGQATLDRINFPDYTSIYPGAAQLAFAAAHRLAPWSAEGLRLVFLLADAAALGVILALLSELGRPRMSAALYWCNPLVVLAGVGAVHVDALLPPLVLGALLAAHHMRPALAAALLALAVGVKIWPALLAPLLARHRLADWRRLVPAALAFTLIAGAALAPLFAAAFFDRSGLSAYAVIWHNNNAPFAWLSGMLGWFMGADNIWAGRLLRLAAALAGASIALLLAARPLDDLRGLLTRALAISASVFYLSPAQFPWYGLWFLPLAAVTQCRPLLLASATLPFYYLFFPLAEMGERGLFQNGAAFLHAAPVWTWLLWRRFGARGARAL